MVESITFVFENCESIEIPIKYIGLFYINDITQSVRRLTLNSVKKINVAKELFIEIFSEGDERFNKYCSCGCFERIVKYRDIVYVEVNYQDGNVDTIYVDYDGDTQNKNQDDWISNLGNLYVSISRKKLVEDYIRPSEANDAAQVNLRKPIELVRSENPELLKLVGLN